VTLDFDQIGADILSGSGDGQLVEIDDKVRGGQLRLICLAKHDQCEAVLKDDDTFSLAPYDAAFEEIGGAESCEAILGANTQSRKVRVAMLRAASSQLVERCAGKAASADARPQDHLQDWVSDLTRKNCETVLNVLRQQHLRRGNAQPFNLIREYIWPIAYMSVRDIVGVELSDKPNLLNRLIILGRNLASLGKENNPSFRPKGVLAASSQAHQGLLCLAGHIVDFGSGKSGAVSFMAEKSLKSFFADYERNAPCIVQCEGTVHDGPVHDAPMHESSMSSMHVSHGNGLARELYDPALRRAIQASPDWQSDFDYDTFVRNILLELAIAMGGLMPLAFTHVFQFVTGPGLAKAEHEPGTFARCMSSPAHAHSAFSEALRLNPAVARVYRTATKDTRIGGIDVREGDRIALLLKSAAQDPSVFERPDQFEPGRTDAYLEFGHTLGAHSCFGQHLAKTIFTVMYQSLVDLTEPAFPNTQDGLHLFAGGLPDHMPWRFPAANSG